MTNACSFCSNEVDAERWNAGYHHCRDSACVAAWRRGRQQEYALHLLPKQGFTIVPRSTAVSGKSSGR